MKVSHVKPQKDISLASMPGDKYYYRTEVMNNNDVPIKIIWFDFYYKHNGTWTANNITNGVMRESNFLKWYSEGKDDQNFKDGWLLPGKIATCDPNWNFGCADSFHPTKWSFIAVDNNGRTYFDESEISKESVIFHSDRATLNS